MFYDANEAYEYLLDYTICNGEVFDDTRAIFNCGFYLMNPAKNLITNKERGWSEKYAKAEWEWYLSGDPSIDKLGEIYGKIPPIWERMANSDREVMSNYGWQWQRNGQLDYVVEKLKDNPSTRQAAISIYDAKEHDKYSSDTPCTYAIQFSIRTVGIIDKLCMSVYMRSNDIWYGFCNDQYQFSMLQQTVAERLGMELGWYYHHAHNMHLYNNKL